MSNKRNVFDDDNEESKEEGILSINKSFAKSYEERKRQEELKLRTY
jgi:hypothetical protein